MPAVTINKGRYFVGDPLRIFPDWKSSPSCTYRAGIYTYHALKFGEKYVAAIPVEAIPEEILKNKKDKITTLVTFEKPTIFYEQDGEGAIGSISL